MSDFLAMGGYAAFVWPAYGLTFLAMTILAIASRRAFLSRERELAVLQALVRTARK